MFLLPPFLINSQSKLASGMKHFCYVPRNERPFSLLHLFISFLFGIVVSPVTKWQFLPMEGSAADIQVQNIHVPKTSLRHLSSSRHLTIIDGEGAELVSLSEHQNSCNALKAFEELTHLHKKAKALEEHHRRGEANSVRRATIARKANAAMAAEKAFRACAGTMMPELLRLWDRKLKSGELNFREWDDAKEKSISGITFATLEETADVLDSSKSQ